MLRYPAGPDAPSPETQAFYRRALAALRGAGVPAPADGADVAHLLRARGEVMDWPRLLGRFGPHWRVLLSHLTLFGFAYPGERQRVPDWVTRELAGRLLVEADAPPPAERVCFGTLLSG